MILKKIAITMLLAGMGVAAPAFAGWYTCSVVNTGATTSAIRIKLSDDGGAFTNRWFEVAPAREKETLAAALSAQVGGRKMLIQLDSTAAFSQIKGAYLK